MSGLGAGSPEPLQNLQSIISANARRANKIALTARSAPV
jgi:hypothetical protein